MSSIDADVVIVGGGMVGGLLAWSLGHGSLRVVLVERGQLSDAANQAGERSTALSWGSRQLLHAAGLWSELAQAATAIDRIHVSQQGHLGSVRMAAEDHKIDALGYVIRNASLLSSLAQRLPTVPNLELITSAQITSLAQHDLGAHLTLSDGRQLFARLVVVADGSNSATRTLAGLYADYEDYEQQAVVATLSTMGTLANTAWERFTANGPMALLPLGPSSLSLVYTTPSERADELMALEDDAFIERVQSGIGRRVGRIVATSRRQIFPLQRVSVNPSWQNRVVLLGNAARTLHPVAGQGFNLALRDVMTLAELLQELALGQDSGAAFVREQYLLRRQADQRQTIGLTDVLARTFRGRSSVLGHLRGAGLIATDRLPLLREGFARRSMGLAHRTAKVTSPPVQ